RHDFADKSRGERLQKVLADAGVASRRECEELILGGAVTVNDHLVDSLPAWVDPDNDRVEVHGRPLRKPEKHVYIVLFKPRGTVCTNSDPEGRPRAIDLVQHPSRPRLYCVGRLDLDASGLLVLTNDGEFANRLTHPRFGVTKGYDLVIDGSLGNEDIARIEREIFKAGRGSEMRSSLRLLKRDRDKTTVHLELAEHRNLQIKPLMMEVGHPVNKMRRTSFGPLKLKGLAVGEWRELTSREVEQLRSASRGADVAPARPARSPRRSMEEFAEQREERARARELEQSTAHDGAARDDAHESRRPDRRTSGGTRADRGTHPAREARGPKRDARGPQRDARGTQRDARGPQRDA
ncbi:MAG: pseudouridine synthase, partial [Phycisphaerales bacterium]